MTVNLQDIHAARKRIAPLVHETPVLTSQRIDDLAGASLFFKSEHLQKVGAFKARGAANVVFSLPMDQVSKGVATHSSGNHGSALAMAAKLRGIPAYIVVPSNAKQVKKDAIAANDGTIFECQPTLAARESRLAEVVQKTGAHFVPPYDDDGVIAGQGTVGLELLEQVSRLDAVVIPVGGGGLLAGCAVAIRSSDASIRIYGAEPEGADDAHRSFHQGTRVVSHDPDTISDGLLTTLGERNFSIIQEQVDDILLVSDAETSAAMELIWTRMKQVVEPSAAVSLAAVLRNPSLFKGQRIGLILTGGNVDVRKLPFS